MERMKDKAKKKKQMKKVTEWRMKRKKEAKKKKERSGYSLGGLAPFLARMPLNNEKAPQKA